MQVRTLTEISRELALAKSSVSNLCVALEKGGLIRRSGGGFLLGYVLMLRLAEPRSWQASTTRWDIAASASLR